jgi:hypothetical protein
MRDLTSAQETFLAIAPKVTSFFSILGSGWIVAEVWVCSNKRYFVYHKLVSAMALYSVLVSAGYFSTTWSIEKEGACSAQGFLIQLQLGTLIYFAMLGLYYMLVISFSYSEDRLTNDGWELFFHLVPALLGLGTAIACLSLDLYNSSDESSSWCWIEETQNCQDKACSGRITAFQWGLYLGPAWVCLAAMLATLVSVFQGVQAQERRMKKYILTAQQTSSYPENSTENCEDDAMIPVNSSTSSSRRSSVSIRLSQGTRYISQGIRRRVSHVTDIFSDMPRTRQVISQAFCYVGALVISNVCMTLVIAWPSSREIPFGILAFQAFAQPLLGFLIFLAYRRPTYLRLRRQGFKRREAIRQTLQWDFAAFHGGPTHRRQGGGRFSIRRRASPYSSGGRKSKKEKAKKVMTRRNSDPGLGEKPARPSLLLSWRRGETSAHRSEPKNVSCGEELELAEDQEDLPQDSGENEKPALRHSGKDSSSTISTLRSSMISTNTAGSSRQFQLTREASMQLDALVMACSSDDDESDSSHRDHRPAGDLEQGSPRTRTTRPGSSRGLLAGRNQRCSDFEMMRQQSQHFFDLVCMDIIPDASSPTEEKWRALVTDPDEDSVESDSEIGNRSFPTLSSYEKPLELPSLENLKVQPPPRQTSNSSRLFAMIHANPLFNRSRRFITEIPDDEPTPKERESDLRRMTPSRTTSGGYLAGQKKPDRRFWAKLELEKKRKEMLKAIYQKGISNSDELDDEESPTKTDSRTLARLELDKKRRGLLKAITKNQVSPPRSDRSGEEEIESPSSFKGAGTGLFGEGNANQFWSRLELDKKRQEILKSIVKTRLSHRNLMDHIPEISEHEESQRSRDDGSEKVESSNELSLHSKHSKETIESSNEMSHLSSDSKQTIQRSNRRSRKDTLSYIKRMSTQSSDKDALSSDDDISLVSDTPLSNDGDFSDSSSDTESPPNDDPKRLWEKICEAKERQEELRSSLRELQRISSGNLSDSDRIFAKSAGSLDVTALKHSELDEIRQHNSWS